VCFDEADVERLESWSRECGWTKSQASRLVAIWYPTAAHHRAARQWILKLLDQRISYTDAVSFSVMRAADCSIAMSFDRHFALAGFLLWRMRG